MFACKKETNSISLSLSLSLYIYIYICHRIRVRNSLQALLSFVGYNNAAGLQVFRIIITIIIIGISCSIMQDYRGML